MGESISNQIDRIPEKRMRAIISDLTRRDLNDGWGGVDNKRKIILAMLYGHLEPQPMEEE
jgi:hypothetical protein